MAEPIGYLEFAKFTPGPKARSHKYKQYADACILHHPQGDSFSAQGADFGPEVRSLHLVFNLGSADANEFGKACANNSADAVKSVEIISTFMLNGTRKEKRKIKYELLTVKQVQVENSAGEDLAVVSCVVEYMKAKGKITDFEQRDGTVRTTSDVNLDFTVGDFK